MKIENNQVIQASDFAEIAEHFSCPISLEIQNFLEKYNGNIVTSDDAGI